MVREYEHFLGRKNDQRLRHEAEEATRGPAWIEKVEVHHEEPRLVLDIEARTEDESVPVHVAVGLDLSSGTQVCAFSTHRDGLEALSGRRRYRVRLELPELPLQKAELDLYVFLMDDGALHAYDQRIVPQAVRVDPPSYTTGLLDPPHRWQVE